jgi:hypothetical protein
MDYKDYKVEKLTYCPLDSEGLSDIPDMSFIQDTLLANLNEMQDNLLKDVLRQLLDREPTIDDAKNVTIFRYYGQLDYDLAYKGSKIGRVTFQNEGFKFGCTFTPTYPK